TQPVYNLPFSRLLISNTNSNNNNNSAFKTANKSFFKPPKPHTTLSVFLSLTLHHSFILKMSDNNNTAASTASDSAEQVLDAVHQAVSQQQSAEASANNGQIPKGGKAAFLQVCQVLLFFPLCFFA